MKTRTVGEVESGHRPRLDFRFEVLAPPTEEMWEAMQRASLRLGMASAGEDAHVNELNEVIAELTGHERALFLPTTTMGIVLAWQALDLVGTQTIIEERCHHWWIEQLHMAAYAGAAPVLVRGDKFGAMSLNDIEAAVDRSYYGQVVRTGLISIENTHNVCGGTCMSVDYTADVAEFARSIGAALFIDGARLFNSAVAQGVELRELAKPGTAVVLSLSKGLLAPVGGMISGPTELIERVELLARRNGALAIHKAGLLAAAVLVGLRDVERRLAEDHARARRLAMGIKDVDGLSIDLDTVQTNFVRVDTQGTGLTAADFSSRLAAVGVGAYPMEKWALKMITYSGVSDEMIDEAVNLIHAVVDSLS